MKSPDDDAQDLVLEAALSRLPRTLEPREGYADRVMEELRAKGVIRTSRRGGVRPVLQAAMWFIAGVGTGAGALAALRNESTPPEQFVSLTKHEVPTSPAEPVEWY